ncbi:hypothetical protein HG530_001494 [Fusarium avenaceum]|nr:hypothetical protein HG530_001494 [Fusarium avenaceum]
MVDLEEVVGEAENGFSDLMVATWVPVVPLVYKQSDMEKKEEDSDENGTRTATTTGEGSNENAASTRRIQCLVGVFWLMLGVLGQVALPRFRLLGKNSKFQEITEDPIPDFRIQIFVRLRRKVFGAEDQNHLAEVIPCLETEQLFQILFVVSTDINRERGASVEYWLEFICNLATHEK